MKNNYILVLIIGILLILDNISFMYFNYAKEFAPFILGKFILSFFLFSIIYYFLKRTKYINYLISLYILILLITFKILQYSFFAILSKFFILFISLIFFISIKYCFDKFKTKELLIIVSLVTFTSLASNYSLGKKSNYDIEFRATSGHDILVDKISSIKLKNKPNIYLIGFDSMTSKSWQKKYFGYEESYISTLEKYYDSYSGFNLYVPTLHSLNAIMRFDQDRKVYGSIQPTIGLVNGKYQSPLLSLLNSNGYETNLYHWDTYFGEKGRYLDNLILNEKKNLRSTAFCQSSNELQKNIFLLGACKKDSLFNKVTSKYFRDGVEIADTLEEWPKFLIPHAIEKSSISNQPQFNILFFYRPIGHVSNTYDNNNKDHIKNYKKVYSKYSNLAKSLLETIRHQILNKDPDALVIIFGDHGPYMSNGLDCSKNKNKIYCIHNTYAANISVLRTKNVCSKKYKSFIRGNVITPSEIIFSKLSCLSEEKNILSQFIKYRDSAETKPGFFESLESYRY